MLSIKLNKDLSEPGAWTEAKWKWEFFYSTHFKIIFEGECIILVQNTEVKILTFPIKHKLQRISAVVDQNINIIKLFFIFLYSMCAQLHSLPLVKSILCIMLKVKALLLLNLSGYHQLGKNTVF